MKPQFVRKPEPYRPHQACPDCNLLRTHARVLPRGSGVQELRQLLAEAREEKAMIEFTVYGTPRPQGSTRAFFVKKLGRAVITTDNTKLKPWRQQISDTALSLAAQMFQRETPVEVTMNFYFTKPASAKKRRGMTVKPDIDKTARAILDAITGVLIVDDAQVVEMHARKHYGGPERVEIRVEEAV